ncbi:MAG: hypothetical protein FJZ16_03990 [Candidatus Omnitrophica bacterium]|nr:hypothetical protein [Candidatus Omnitrophota bacterium]
MRANTKLPITIVSNTDLCGLDNFYISFRERRFLLLNYYPFNLRSFIAESYLTKFITKFKEPALSCFLILTLIEKSNFLRDNVRQILAFASETFFISKTLDKKHIVGETCGYETHCLMFDDMRISNIQKMITLIEKMDIDGYFVFDKQANKDIFLATIRDLWNEKNHEKIISSFSEVINIYALCFNRIGWAVDESHLHIYTHRFDKDQIGNLIYNSVDKDKFEVIVK